MRAGVRTIVGMRTLAIAALVIGCTGVPAEIDAGELELDSGRDDAGAVDVDGGEDAGSADLDGGRDAGVAVDAGSDAGPLPSCVGEGIWRGSTTWCDDLATVLAAYDCELVFETDSAGTVTWSGSVESIRTLTFVLGYQGLSPSRDRAYACHRPAPSESYAQTCEVPFLRGCMLDRSDELCGAAEERGIATHLAFNTPLTGCRDEP